MQETLTKLGAPVVWLGIISVVVGIFAHFSPPGMIAGVTAQAFLEFTQVCFLFAIAVGVLNMRSG